MSAATVMELEIKHGVNWRKDLERRLCNLEARLGLVEKENPEAAAIHQQNVILDVVSERYGVLRDALKTPSHRVVFVYPRQIAMYLMYATGMFSYPEIGRFFGRHHTTVVHAVAKVDDMRREDPKVNDAISELSAKIEATI